MWSLSFLVLKHFFNPFDNSNADLTHIHHLTSDLITNESTTASILSAYDQGEQLYTTFVNERILSSKKISMIGLNSLNCYLFILKLRLFLYIQSKKKMIVN